MLTRRGWLMVASAAAMVILGRLLGLEELYVLAAAAALAVVAAVIYVRSVQVELGAARLLRPARVHLGSPCRVDLRLVNRGRFNSPALAAEDSFDHGRLVAGFEVPSLAPRAPGRAAYRVPTDRRGRFTIGPLSLVVEDPFGLAVRRHPVAGTTTVIVYPRIHPLAPMAPTPGYDPHSGTQQRGGRIQGEDFYALRTYQVGDDLRQVHWPSTAKADDLMIRQMEQPWQQRVTAVLDLRRSVHTAASLELAVSAAASVITASWQAGAVVRLVTSAGFDSGFDGGRAHWEALLAALAGVATSGGRDLGPTLSRLRRHEPGAAVVVVTTSAATPADLSAVAHLRDRAGAVTLVSVERSAYDPGAPSEGLQPSRLLGRGVRLVRVTRDRPLAEAWGPAPAGAAPVGR
ncbi:MAG TPA: DUF58 domain-containing protein [Acidimicrobiales bacterium]|nr:DUF58 domain-containing protein [Acidimicrobiales bacterium]